MKCGHCGEREAVVHFTTVVEGEARMMGLCEVCAEEKGIPTQSAATATPLGGFLAALWKDALPAEQELLPAGRCPGCGATFADFRESGRLGCGVCWSTFEPALRVLLRRYHGSTHHQGRRHAPPGRDPDRAQDQVRQELRAQLDRAIRAENFELAAELRDRLKEIA